MKSHFGQINITQSIFFPLISDIMNASINFNYQSFGSTIEINNIISNAVLSFKS